MYRMVHAVEYCLKGPWDGIRVHSLVVVHGGVHECGGEGERVEDGEGDEQPVEGPVAEVALHADDAEDDVSGDTQDGDDVLQQRDPRLHLVVLQRPPDTVAHSRVVHLDVSLLAHSSAVSI